MPTRREKLSPFVIMYGPTGVGKTDLALALAETLPMAIINMDVGQFYTPFGVGTAKPEWRREPTPHYLFDHLDHPVDYSVADYRKDVMSLLPHVYADGRIPCAVGGSGFYAYSLLFAPHEGTIPSLKEELAAQSTQELWKQLQEIDPLRAAAINEHDRYRIERALAVWSATGEKPSARKPAYQPIANSLVLIGVERDREDLYVRINKRTELMLAQGWIDEVKVLIDTPWEDFLRKKKLIGYPEVFDYVRGTLSYATMVERIQNQTRQYAKRQMTFWRTLERKIDRELLSSQNSHISITTINLTKLSFDRYIKQLSETIVSLQKK